MDHHRFVDRKYRSDDFDREVWVVCPYCGKQAVAIRKEEEKQARLQCGSCGHNKVVSILCKTLDEKLAEVRLPAHRYFKAELWFSMPFGKEVVMAFNPAHLDYLERYIAAKLREHKDRTHFTLLERLPKFYHEARNREALLKTIAKMRKR